MKKKRNQYNLDGEYGIGWTSNTNKEFYFDLEDYDKIKDYCWCEVIIANSTHALQAYDKELKTTIRMHILLGFKGFDHIDRNELNNRKGNLRACSHKDNSRNRNKHKNNTSGIIGVYWMKEHKKWRAHIKINGKQVHLGYFDDKDLAIKARLCAEKEHFGLDFAPQRHLFEQYGI